MVLLLVRIMLQIITSQGTRFSQELHQESLTTIMGIRESIMSIILAGGDPEKAINELLRGYPDPIKSAIAVYSMWSRVKKGLKDAGVNEDVIARFKLPTDIVDERTRIGLERAQMNQQHQLKDRSEYNFTKDEVDSIFEKVYDILNNLGSITNTKKYYDVIVALQLASGRRNYEVMNCLEYSPSSHPYQANVKNICKKDKTVDPVEYTIPLHVEYKVFDHAMREARKFRNVSDKSPSEVNSSYGPRILAASTRLFGRRLTHTQKRNLYVEMAHMNRATNNYLVGSQSCSKGVWASHALCHSISKARNVTERYQTMVIDSS